MRWENLSSAPPDTGPPTGAAPAAPPLPLALPGAVVRTFDTPAFAGMTFYEVQAKSILNRVPGASRVPFEWTINPYRGCSHACAYCLAGETEILLADGGTRPLARLRIGDQIYGTVAQGNHRRYVRTEVLAHWSTVKPAYRITLEDGTELTASGDHRFLTPRGWKHVVGSPPGDAPRPYLALTDSLVGTGRSASTPDSRPGGPGGRLDGTILGSRAAVRIRGIEPLERELRLYDITTGTGDFIANGVVSHNCFARNTHTYLDLDAGRDFDSKVIVKVNAGELVRRELAAPKWRGDHIAMGTNVDCYQRAEGRYRLMPPILTALRDFANPFSILTKGTLILRDLPLLRQAATVTRVSISLSVGFVDEPMWRSVESGTPSPRRRLDAVRELTDAGFQVGVLMAPILPGLTDTEESIEATVAAIAAAGAVSVTPLPLHLRPGAREWYAAWLGREFPQLVPRYRALFGKGSYLPQAYQREVTARVRMAARRHGLHRAESGEARQVTPTDVPAPVVEQLTLL
ncbi:Rv2578c family radical SAM protein [Plantactinospora solaniradicis]|uniref:Rv2578c family radical SAM protein n=1 Tax=Plantactinospora solaniradicis TaxID=1723736 RepID=A0ABW1K1D6_9ACTN